VGQHTPLRRRWTNSEIVICPSSILSEQLSPTALRLWIALAQFANDDRRCWPSRRRLLTMMPPSTAKGSLRRARAELEKANLLEVEYRKDPSTGRDTTPLYTLLIPVGEGHEMVPPEGHETEPPEGHETEPLNLISEHEQKEEVVDNCQTVFKAWVEATGKHPSRTRLDDKRRRIIQKALETYPVEDVLDAVVGWKYEPFYKGENDRGRPFNDLGLLLRDSEHIERFRDMGRFGATALPSGNGSNNKHDPNVKFDEDGNKMRFASGTGWMRVP